ncbi:MAR-binding filament-like protein 1-1 [Nicotiana sylvestris]|uniref:MAR-binding filament-like protein 1-1 n=1 Tax=Nicotiana sylvestris TaxID=4096 RepID=UPI00388C3ED8
MELSKGRWEARNHGLPKDVAIRPLSGDEDVPLKSIAPKDESEEEEEEDISKLVARVRAGVTVQEVLKLTGAEVEQSQHEEASVLHHEAFLRYRKELTHREDEVRDLTEKNDTYKLLSEKLQADLVMARDKHAEMAEQVDAIQDETEEFKKSMDILASKGEAAQAQLESAEIQLRATRDKASVQVKKIEELQSQLDLAVSDQANLVNELEAAKFEVVVTNTKTDAKVVQFKGVDNIFGDCFAGVEEGVDLDPPVVLEEAAKLQKKVMMLYDQYFSKLRAELTHNEEEFEMFATESKELKTLYARREKELNSLQASSEKVLQERANFIVQELWLPCPNLLTKKREVLPLLPTRPVVQRRRLVRLSPFDEEEGPSIFEARKDNKRKRSSKNEDSHNEAGSARGSEKDVAADKDLIFIGRSMEINAPGEDDSILIARTRRSPETVEPAGPEAPSLEGEIPQARKGECPSSTDLAASFRTSGSAPRGIGFDVYTPNQSASGGSIRADETEQVDTKSTFEEAQRLCSMAFNKLKSELLRCGAKLRKALNGEKSLRLVYDKKTRELIHLRSELDQSRDYEGNLEKQVTSILGECRLFLPSLETNILVSLLQRKTETLERLRGESHQVNSECNDVKAQIDVHVTAKRNALAKASTLEIQFRNAREGDSVKTSRIAKLEIDLLKMKAEVVNARAEAEKVRAKADKKVAIYLKDKAEARTKLRGASDERGEAMNMPDANPGGKL